MMRAEAQRERDSKFDDYETLAPSAEEPRKPVVAVDPEPVEERAKPTTKAQKAGRGGYLLAAAGALALAVLGGGLWAINWEAGLGGATSTPTVPLPPPEPEYDGPMYQGLPIAVSDSLDFDPWTQLTQPYRSQPQVDPAVFVADGELLASDTGEIEFVGQVVSERDDVVMAGELTVSLVNRRGEEKARTTAPITMLSKDHSLPVRMPIPATLDPRTLSPAWSISNIETNDSLTPVQDVYMLTEAMGTDTMARIFLTNDTELNMDRVWLLVTAWDSQGLALRRWRASWEMPIAPGQDAEFFARTVVGLSWEVESWTVIAFAQTSPAQPEPDSDKVSGD